jgi:prepilin-type N-terminal cleavage/methylation domain-containing protein
MKNPSSSRRGGFTLVELLVVIAIIAVLASAGFAAGNAAMNRARTVSAQATAVAVESAVNTFYSEYGYMPVEVSDTEDIQPIRTDDPKLLTVLLGKNEQTQPPLNRKEIQFLVVKEGQRVGNRGKGGLVYSADGNSVIGLFDPWGNPFFVALDTNYDDRLEVTLGSRPSQRLNGRKVAVYSAGSDQQLGTTKDVKTW